ncbi:GTPase HflX, partial [bacterium]|nr:GTPase HflX [bacterium]
AGLEVVDEVVQRRERAGLEVVDEVVQRRERADPRTVLGKGRAQQLAIQAMQRGVELLVFDQELTPSQSKALAALADVKILDRTGLILDVFAQRARSRDGRLQVELAQLKYRMPHLSARDDALSRLAGGIGGRGPGETRLEIDRRRARDRVARLEREVKDIGRQRSNRRARRSKAGTPV